MVVWVQPHRLQNLTLRRLEALGAVFFFEKRKDDPIRLARRQRADHVLLEDREEIFMRMNGHVSHDDVGPRHLRFSRLDQDARNLAVKLDPLWCARPIALQKSDERAQNPIVDGTSSQQIGERRLELTRRFGMPFDERTRELDAGFSEQQRVFANDLRDRGSMAWLELKRHELPNPIAENAVGNGALARIAKHREGVVDEAARVAMPCFDEPLAVHDSETPRSADRGQAQLARGSIDEHALGSSQMRTSISLGIVLIACACGSTSSSSEGEASDASASSDASIVSDGGSPSDAASSSSDAGAIDAGDPVAQLLALTASCDQISNGLFSLNGGDTPTVPICGLTNAVFWKADMDIDCDGKQTTQCNITADPDYQNQTAAVDSMGNPLDSANLPYVVVPGKSTRFDSADAGLAHGSVILVLYKNQIGYAVFGDVGPSADIGEASYATAVELGIDPNPKTGGVDAPDVLYVAFTGTSAVAKPIEDHAQAVSVGQTQLAALLAH
jgi:Fungal chitosanase of glycosyl hydrolase group 75